jgi:hypothetical protein
MSIKDLPADARPREKLLARGPQALSDVELLAILLRTGMAGKNVFQLAQELLDPGGIAGLLQASPASLKSVKGLGPAKKAELLAVFEIARRAMLQRLPIALRIHGITLIALAGLLAMAIVSAASRSSQMEAERGSLLRAVVDSAIAIAAGAIAPDSSPGAPDPTWLPSVAPCPSSGLPFTAAAKFSDRSSGLIFLNSIRLLVVPDPWAASYSTS